MSKIDAKIRLEYSDETLILRGNFFSKCSKNFSIGLMIMFKVCRRCLQRFSLRCKKNYERTIRTSKYIQKKLTPLIPSGGEGVNSFNATLTRFGTNCLELYVTEKNTSSIQTIILKNRSRHKLSKMRREHKI